MTEKPSYEELERQLAEAKKENKHLKKKSKNKETYAQKHVKLFEKFFLGKANLNEFPRVSRSKKTESAWQYFFIRNGKACFQYKSFILDMIEAYCLVNDLPKQRESMMRYELKKALSGKTKKPGQTDEVKTRKAETPPVEKTAEDVAKETQATYQKITEMDFDAMAIDDVLAYAKTNINPPASVRQSLFRQLAKLNATDRNEELWRLFGTTMQVFEEDLAAIC
jgi:hypothetical protein